jgi:hypothetical protein
LAPAIDFRPTEAVAPKLGDGDALDLLLRVADAAAAQLEKSASGARVSRPPGPRDALDGGVTPASRRGAVVLGRDLLARVRRPGNLPQWLPPELAVEARLWAREGHGRAVADVCLVGQELFWEQLTASAEALVDDACVRWELLQLARARLTGYGQRISELLRREYQRELARVAAGGETPGQRLIRRVLADESLQDADVDFWLAREHVAVVADTVGVLRALAGHAERELLDVPSTNGAVWGWLVGAEPFSERALAALVTWQRGRAGQVAFGEPGTGIAGFRASHRQALDAWRILRLSGEQAVRYADVALAAQALQDPTWSRALVVRELGPLGSSNRIASRVRRSVQVYLELGCNASSAAASLGCHRSTVNAHVTRVERHRGCAVRQRSAELQLALQLAGLGVHPEPEVEQRDEADTAPRGRRPGPDRALVRHSAGSPAG